MIYSPFRKLTMGGAFGVSAAHRICQFLPSHCSITWWSSFNHTFTLE